MAKATSDLPLIISSSSSTSKLSLSEKYYTICPNSSLDDDVCIGCCTGSSIPVHMNLPVYCIPNYQIVGWSRIILTTTRNNSITAVCTTLSYVTGGAFLSNGKFKRRKLAHDIANPTVWDNNSYSFLSYLLSYSCLLIVLATHVTFSCGPSTDYTGMKTKTPPSSHAGKIQNFQSHRRRLWHQISVEWCSVQLDGTIWVTRMDCCPAFWVAQKYRNITNIRN